MPSKILKQMKNRPKGFWALIGVLAVSAMDAAYHYPLLPARVASHFGASGQADGWMPKDAFMVMNASLLLFTAVLMGSIQTLVRYLPDDSINLPNKEYWLAPERRALTMNIVGSYFLWFAVATNTLLAAILHLVYRANLSSGNGLNSLTWIILGAYLAYTAIWTISLTRGFKIDKDTAGSH
jgi:uncharacterized membrane protein